MMGGIRNVNLQEQQWHLVCNDPLSGLDRCKKAKCKRGFATRKEAANWELQFKLQKKQVWI